ncbi:hypothetical protein [Dokdonella koreensis]|nr:hypothetical protein [Dokdonella koreensis]
MDVEDGERTQAVRRLRQVVDRYWGVYAPMPDAVHEETAGYAATRLPLWQQAQGLPATAVAMQHWRKHRHRLPEFANAVQYVEAANTFLRRPPAGTLTKTRANGDRLYYDPARNLLGVASWQGLPRTLFRPYSGMGYWSGL